MPPNNAMTNHDLLEIAREYLEISSEHESGLVWKKRSSRRIQVGQKVGSLSGCGYYSTSVFGRRMHNHRLIFLLTHGYIPKYIDHIDGNRRNNHPSNLRAATSTENAMNAGRRRDNKTGVTGVYKEAGAKSWRASIAVGGREIKKRFSRFEDAVQWRSENEIKYFGRFSPMVCRPAKDEGGCDAS